MNTNIARLLCAMTLLLMLAATVLAQDKKVAKEQKEGDPDGVTSASVIHQAEKLVSKSQKAIISKGDGPLVTPTGADVTVGSGVTVTLGSGVNLSLGGNFINNGTVTANLGSNVDFNGAAAETLSGATTFSKLTKSGGGTLKLNSAVTVNDTLVLNAGSINNLTNPINLASGASVQNNGGSVSNPPTSSGPVDVTYSNASVLTTGSELPTSATGLRNLTMNGAGGVILNSSATVNGALALTNGKITLGGNNLALGPTATISGGSSSSYIETSGNGVFTRKAVGSTPKSFPVGVGGSYNPATVTNSGTPDTFSVRVKTTFDSPPAQPTKAVNRQWTVTESVSGGSNATLTFQWNASDQASGFSTASAIAVNRHNGSQWVERSATFNASPLTATASGFTAFSPFSVGNVGAFPSFSQALAVGWNMISLPNNPSNAYYLSLYPSATPGTLYDFGGTYTQRDTLRYGKGYWLRMNSSANALVSGASVTANTYSLVLGWNMIGGLSCVAALSGVSDPGNIIVAGTLYGFNGAYFSTDTLRPGKGYWIRTRAAGTVTFNCAPGSFKAVVPPDIATFPSLNIRDTTGAGQKLFWNVKLEEPQQKLSYSLPAVPPSGAFDARFANDFRISEAEGGLIQIQSASYPLMIAVSNLPVDTKYSLTEITSHGEGQTHPLISGEAISISNADVKSLRIEKIQNAPRVFSLGQNYPNPFNPSTQIKFTVAEINHTTLEIYNLLGQKVSTLFDDVAEPGRYYTVHFSAKGGSASGGDAVNLASGVYFYRLVSGKQSDLKKLLLLK